MTSSTTTNVLSEEWALNDEVIRLRVWGTDRVFPLFSDTRDPYTIGTATTCSIRIEDPMRRASREHARLERIHGRWGMIDGGSKNGLYQDGAKTDKFRLSPGVEIGLGGGIVLVAESARWIVLRNILTRMLGWSADRAKAVDLALRGIRFAAMRRAVLVLCGEDDLVPIAEELHRLTLTAARPFVLCNPRRRAGATPERAAGGVTSGVAAVEAAAGGTVCLLHKNIPSDLDDMLYELRQPHCQTQLVMCAANVRDAALFAAAPVIVPRVSSRKAEIDRVIIEYAAEAAGIMGIGVHWLSPAERVWIRDHLGDSLPDIQRATLRLAAIRRAGSISAGALKVGISHTAMLKWLRHYEFPDLEILRASNDVPGAAAD
jgi:pSer/pThr/pTyr-binding forkhead associated (FHA) protein